VSQINLLRRPSAKKMLCKSTLAATTAPFGSADTYAHREQDQCNIV